MGDPEPVRKTADQFRRAVETLDTAGLSALMREDVELFSPVPRAPFAGHASVMMAFEFLATVVEQHHFVTALYGDDEAVLSFKGVLAGRECEWTHHIRIDAAGLIYRITDMLRPLSAVLALRDAVTGAPANVELIRAGYQAFAEFDLDRLLTVFGEDAVFHIGGHHPLSGDYLGRDAVFDYFLRVATITGGNGGYEIHGLFGSADSVVVLLTGTAHSQGRPFRRRMIHVHRIGDDQVQETWDLPFDQRAEDEFWRGAAG